MTIANEVSELHDLLIKKSQLLDRKRKESEAEVENIVTTLELRKCNLRIEQLKQNLYRETHEGA